MNTTGKEGYWLIVQGLRPGLNDGEEPNKWQMLSVKDLCTYIGSGGTPSTSVPEYWSGTISWITGADFTERGIGVIRRYITDSAVVFWRVPNELGSRHGRLLFGE